MLKEKSYKRNQGGVYFLVREGRDQKREAERKSEFFSIKKIPDRLLWYALIFFTDTIASCIKNTGFLEDVTNRFFQFSFSLWCESSILFNSDRPFILYTLFILKKKKNSRNQRNINSYLTS